MKQYDVIIVNYNGEKIICDCLDSLYNSIVLPDKVIIYDNASQDNSVQIISEKYPKVILVAGKENLGFGRANNEAMKYSTSEFILFMNNDIILNKNCSQELLKGFSGKNLAVINPLIFKGWDKNKVHHVYSFGAVINRSGFGYSLYNTEPDRDDLTCFSGACFLAKSHIIKKLQFEKSFFLYYEEIDLSIKMLIGGYSIGRRSRAKCYHLENYSSPQKKADGVCFRQYYAIQNHWFILGKFWPTGELLLAMPLSILHLSFNLLLFVRHNKISQISIAKLAFESLLRGRKEYKKKLTHDWVKYLASNNLKKVFGLLKKVYR